MKRVIQFKYVKWLCSIIGAIILIIGFFMVYDVAREQVMSFTAQNNMIYEITSHPYIHDQNNHMATTLKKNQFYYLELIIKRYKSCYARIDIALLQKDEHNEQNDNHIDVGIYYKINHVNYHFIIKCN